METFVKTLEGLPNVAAGHQKCAGGLIHGTFAIEIAILIAVSAIDRIGGP
jgi:hypothetical protein